jgi:hypothetical protein
MLLLELVGEVVTDEEVALNASENIDSSLALVFRGGRALADLSPPAAIPLFIISSLGNVFNDPVDFENGDSSIGVTLMWRNGESND